MKQFRVSILALAALVVWLVPLAGDAQQAEFKVDTLLSVDKLTPNTHFRLAVVIDVAEHWHINANPANAEGLIPTTLTLQPPASIVIDRIIYPKGMSTKVAWNDEPVALYTGRTIVFAEGHVTADARSGPLKLGGSLRYQACNDSVCIAPKNIPVVMDTEIVPESQKPQPVHADIFGAATPSAPLAPLVTAGNASADNPIATLVRERGDGLSRSSWYSWAGWRST